MSISGIKGTGAPPTNPDDHIDVSPDSPTPNQGGLATRKKSSLVPKLKSALDMVRGGASGTTRPDTTPRSDTVDIAPRPAVDPLLGTIDYECVSQAARQMRAALPALPANSSTKAQNLHTELSDALRSIQGIADSSRAMAEGVGGGKAAEATGAELTDRLPVEQRVVNGYALRDGFSKASELAHKLANALAGTAQKTVYEDISALFRELKHVHLTAVAPDDTQATAKKQSRNIENVAAGFAADRPGALHISNVSVGASGGVVGAVLAGGVKKGQAVIKDDDLATLGFGGQMGIELSGKLGVNNVAKAVLSGSTSATTKFYATSSHENVVKHRVSDDANSLLGKTLGKGSGPSSRKLRQSVDLVKNMVKVGMGRSSVPTLGAPIHLNDARLAQGFTTTKLHLLAKSIDGDLGTTTTAKGKAPGTDGQWTNIVQSFYPSVPQVAKQALEAEQALPEKTALDKAFPPPLAFGRAAISAATPTVGVEFQLGVEQKENKPPRGIGAGFSTKYEHLLVGFRAPVSAHEVMDTSRTKDMAQVFKLAADYDALVDRPTHQPKLTQYAAVKQALGGTAVDGFTADEYYGTNVPPQFHEAIAHPSGNKLLQAGDECLRIAGLAATLGVEGEKLMSNPDKNTPPTIRPQLATMRQEAFRALNEQIWGAQYGAGNVVLSGGYPGGEASALKNPEKFLARSHDALSTALGLAGVHISINKRELVQQDRVDTRGAMQTADDAYSKAREYLDKGAFLPVRKEKLVRDHSSVKATGLVDRPQGTGSVAASGGALTNLLALGDSQVAKTIRSEDVTVDSSVLKLGVQAQVQARVTKRQALDTRLGHEIEATLTLESGLPFTGEAINKAACFVLERYGMKPDEAALQLKDVTQQAANALSTINPNTNGITLQLAFRQAPTTDACNMQYFRLCKSGLTLEKISGKLKGTGASTSVGLTEVRRGVEWEMLGSDLGYASMQHGPLKGALEQARETLVKGGKADATLHDAANALFCGDGTNGVQPDGFLRDRYFGNGQAILGVLEQYLDYMHAKDTNSMPQRGEQFPNEFFRWFNSEPYSRARKVANEVEHHAPGSSAKGVDPFAPPPPLTQTEGLQINVAGGGTTHDKNSPEWAAIKQRLQGMSPEQRAQFYTTDPTGKQLFNSYMGILTNVEKTWVATLNHAEKDRSQRRAGFTAEVVDQGKPPRTRPALPTFTMPTVKIPTVSIPTFTNTTARPVTPTAPAEKIEMEPIAPEPPKVALNIPRDFSPDFLDDVIGKST